MTESKITEALKGMADAFGFTPRSLAESFDSLINKQLAVISKEEMKKTDRYFLYYFEMTENVNDSEKPPIVKMIGITKEKKRYFVRNVNFQSEIVDVIMDDAALGTLRMASTMFSIDLKPMMKKFNEKTNKALNDEMMIQGYPVKVVVFVGGESNGGKLKANMSSMSNKFYKKNFVFSSLIPEDEKF